MSARGRIRTLAMSFTAIPVVVLLAVSPVGAQPGDDPPKLGIRPVGQAVGTFFELSMVPGERRQLAVELFNSGTSPVRARSYASEVYTIVNGGFGARLGDEAGGGTSTWLDFAPEVLDLASNAGVSRTFAVTVPPDARPGEHIASLIIENEDELKGSGAVALNQVVRQAVAVLVTVPGPVVPALEIGAARHTVSASKSVVGVAVSNPGNVRLHPKGELVLSDAIGHEVARTPVSMDSFYAATDTFVEVPLAELLQPGRYTVRLRLEDTEHGVEASADSLAFDVVAPPADVVAAGQENSGPLAVEQRTAPIATRIRIWIPIAIAAVALAVGMTLLLRRRRKRLSGYKHVAGRKRRSDG